MTSFALGIWQIKRLQWKTALLARLEDNLARPALPLPPHVDPDAVAAFDYRRVWTTGKWDHDKEILIGPRVREGENGYLVVTPLVREGVDGEDESSTAARRVQRGWSEIFASWWSGSDTSSADNKMANPDSDSITKISSKTKEPILVTRGWIPKAFYEQRDRKEGLPNGTVLVEGLLRQPFKKNMFTPDNAPHEGAWYFPDVAEMARWAGTAPIWLEETMEPSTTETYFRMLKGVPVSREAAVDIRNNHLQYIVTW